MIMGHFICASCFVTKKAFVCTIPRLLVNVTGIFQNYNTIFRSSYIFLLPNNGINYCCSQLRIKIMTLLCMKY